MKNFIALFLVLLLLFSPSNQKQTHIKSEFFQLFNAVGKLYFKPDGVIRIASYNLLSDELGFDGIPTESRNTATIELINTIEPDILGLQEMSYHCFGLLSTQTPLEFVSPLSYLLSRNMTTLMYNPKKLTLLNSGSNAFRYSTNPRLRSYTWGLFEDKESHNIFMAVNTHLNLYEQATPYPLLQAVELIDFCKSSEEKYNCPVFITGDLNSKERTANNTVSSVVEYISLFYENTKTDSSEKSFGADKTAASATNDYIFYSGECNILSFNILSQPELNVLSDHYLIFADISLETPSYK